MGSRRIRWNELTGRKKCIMGTAKAVSTGHRNWKPNHIEEEIDRHYAERDLENVAVPSSYNDSR